MSERLSKGGWDCQGGLSEGRPYSGLGQRPDSDVRVVGSQASQIVCVGRCDDGAAEVDARCNDDGIDGRSGPSTGAQVPCETSRPKVQRQSANAIDEQSINASIIRVAPVDLSQHRERHHPLGALALSPTSDGKCSGPKHSP